MMDIDSAIRRLNDNVRATISRLITLENRVRDLPLEGKGFWVPFNVYGTGGAGPSATGITASGTGVYMAAPGKAMTLQSWTQASHVATTNSGSNYWNIELLQRTSGGATNQIVVYNTSTHAADNWVKTTTAISYAIAVTDHWILLQVTKTGSPGALYLSGVSLYAT